MSRAPQACRGWHDRAVRIAIEATAPEAAALAELLAAEGHDVRIAALDAAAADPPDIAYLDVWTPETAPAVQRLRRAGTRLTNLSDLILERAPGRTLGITGTAGKTTTTAFAVQLLRAAGRETHVSETARAGNLWATAELLPALESTGVIALELTSSHLAFTHASPSVALVTCFWPDHLELHGSLGAYRRAKEAVARHQRPGDRIVLPADDPDPALLAAASPAGRWWFSTAAEVERGAFLAGDALVLRTPGDEVTRPAPPFDEPRLRAALAAAAAALALDVPPDAIDSTGLEPPRFRANRVGHRGGAVIVDDGMAATSTKTAATLRAYAAGSVVLVAGGETHVSGLEVHASPEERRLLEAALDEVQRAARSVIAFGPAAARLADGLRERGVVVRVEADLDAALAAALEERDAAAVLVSPMYPVSLAERERIERWARGQASA